MHKHRLFGRNKCVATRAECDRKSVMKAIRSAIGKIAEKHPALAEHFTDSIRQLRQEHKLKGSEMVVNISDAAAKARALLVNGKWVPSINVWFMCIHNQFLPPIDTHDRRVEFHANAIDSRFQNKMIDNGARGIWFQEIVHFTHPDQKMMADDRLTQITF